MIRRLILMLLAAGTLLSCGGTKTDTSEKTAPAAEAPSPEPEKKVSYDALFSYAREAGLKADSTDPQKMLVELGYGHAPVPLKYTARKLSPDSAVVAKALQAYSEEKKDWMAGLEPSDSTYLLLKEAWKRLNTTGEKDSAAVVAQTLNARRWMHRQTQKAPRSVYVNTRGAYLVGRDSAGNNVLRMRVVVGKPDKPTPAMDTYATQLITHPYWNVPRSIAVEEMLPKIQRNARFLERNNIEVIDAKGNLVDPESVRWGKLSVAKFPYRLRQDTGGDNSLGLLKVELKNPLAIYLHDTNARYLFARQKRWRSHGCVRVQHPADLANFLAGKPLLDSEMFTEPSDKEPPKAHRLPERIPVFLLYLGADIDENGKLVFYPDVYGWDKKGE